MQRYISYVIPRFGPHADFRQLLTTSLGAKVIDTFHGPSYAFAVPWQPVQQHELEPFTRLLSPFMALFKKTMGAY